MTKNIDISLFDYPLPDNRIARHPLPERDASKLLVYKNGQITDDTFRNIADYLPKGATLVRNDTKVIRARLHFSKQTGANIEIFCLEPADGVDVQQSFAGTHEATWTCIVGNSKRWKEAPLTKEISTPHGLLTLSATRLSVDGTTSVVRFSWTNAEVSFAEVIESAGTMPIPPYLCRDTEEEDYTRYQTVYGVNKGSVAAPTAGLHFTPEVLSKVAATGHKIVSVTLHVGAGTFKPVQVNDATQHVMHTEHIVVRREAIQDICNNIGNIVAVGTTSVRTIESLYWLGVKLLSQKDITNGLEQWEAYTLPQDVAPEHALNALIEHIGADDYISSQTQIMITPSYRPRLTSALITNFHQPHSTLLLLISAFVGNEWHKIYDHALANNYRFLSYGDSSILFPNK